ncbi:uncharacterized protein LOC110730013 [Chenopodium quinoa]|uniref:uncharacterized protein LOC110730013 n=1 Tax=Chenopodium quinoa TaxID=63459 RepID=UPI000B78C180|nr:uncharacterized protein LOC110730013 [Chenopodium quinoa]
MVQRLEKEAAQAQINFAATLEAEQNRLVAKSDADNDARMKIAWAALYPDADYSIWALAHSYAEYVVYLREQGEPEPASFEAWVNSNNEPSVPELPSPGEAQEIPSDDEEEDQEAPSAVNPFLYRRFITQLSDILLEIESSFLRAQVRGYNVQIPILLYHSFSSSPQHRNFWISMGQHVLGKRGRCPDTQQIAEISRTCSDSRLIGTGMVPKTIELHPGLFMDDSLTLGGVVKAKGQVINQYSSAMRRPPNMTCRVESFGRICQKFDEQRKRWVCDMGFGGLLHFASHMHLPRQLAYWVMTRIDPINRCFIGTNGCSVSFSKNQVHWILGIPTSKDMSGVVRMKVQKNLLKYGRSWETKANKHCSRTYTSVGIPVTGIMMDRLEGHFDAHQEEEFKTLFLIISLKMILCPTQSPRLSTDLLPALSCCMDSQDYDWCDLVLSKFLESVSNFARRFYVNGFAGGSGGCSIFAVIFYLDRLNLDPNAWDTYPRVKAWTMQRIGYAGKLDRTYSGDYGKLGVIDVAYGERHPKLARTTSLSNL